MFGYPVVVETGTDGDATMPILTPLHKPRAAECKVLSGLPGQGPSTAGSYSRPKVGRPYGSGGSSPARMAIPTLRYREPCS